MLLDWHFKNIAAGMFQHFAMEVVIVFCGQFYVAKPKF